MIVWLASSQCLVPVEQHITITYGLWAGMRPELNSIQSLHARPLNAESFSINSNILVYGCSQVKVDDSGWPHWSGSKARGIMYVCMAPFDDALLALLLCSFQLLVSSKVCFHCILFSWSDVLEKGL
jgi:hypothetical protein